MTDPSTLTCTLLMAVPTAEVLSIAHPTTVIVPDITDPAVGASIQTVGSVGPAVTVTVTLAELESGVPSLSVAVTVMV